MEPSEPSAVTGRVIAPWDEQTVIELNDYQRYSMQHAFTCGNLKHTGRGQNVLVATPEGWVCEGCDYTQLWAHAFMADGAWRASTVALEDLLAKFNR